MMRTHTQAFTLVEILLALAVMGIIGVSVATMLAGTSSVVQAQNDSRLAATRHQVAMLRLSTLTRANAMVLATGPNHVVFWKGDVNGNGKPNLGELRRLEWQSALGEVWMSEAPASLPSASNTEYALNADFSNITAGLAGSGSFPTSLVLDGIGQWELTLDNPSPQLARLLRLQVTYAQPAQAEPVVSIAALRASTP